ncbi:8418_t:CDS:2, partial [Funneliformis geosporum]
LAIQFVLSMYPRDEILTDKEDDIMLFKSEIQMHHNRGEITSP